MKNVAVYKKDPLTEEQVIIDLFESDAYIGTSQNATIQVSDLRVQGFHTYIRDINKDGKNEFDFHVIDLGTGSNTFSNDKTVKEFQIKSGDSFTIGTTELLIQKIPQIMLEMQDLLPETDTPNKNQNKIDESKLNETYETREDILEVSMFWGQQLLETRTFKKKANISIGSESDSTFAITLPDKLNHNLAQFKDQKLKLRLPLITQGLIWEGNEAHTVESVREKNEIKETQEMDYVLEGGDRADLQFGELILTFKFVRPPEKVLSIQKFSVDKKLLKVYIGVVTVFMAFFLLTLIQPPQEEKVVQVPKRLQKVLYEAGIKSAKKVRKSAIGEMLADGGRAKGEAGIAKTKKSNKKVSESKKKQTVAKEAKKEIKATTKKASKTAQTKKARPSLDSLNSSSQSEKAIEKVAITGAPEAGNTISAVSKGQFARGTQGLGSGGGGQSIGIGSLKGLSTGGGQGSGDTGLLASKGKRIDAKINEEIVLLDGLDADTIVAIIKRYLPQIEHCYESRLVHKSSLKGKVVVKFQIIGNGSVRSPSVVQTTLKDIQTERCILNKIKKWKFPRTRGGGDVDVKYPFMLMSTSDN